MCYQRKMVYAGSYRSRWASRRRRRRRGYTSYSSKRKDTSLPYTSRVTLLSKGEAAFFEPLQKAINREYLIMSKVRLADLVTCSAGEWRRGHGGAISQKHLDFVLCDPHTTRFILAIELDDRSHEAPARQRRDRFLNEVLASVGIRLLRVQARSSYSIPWLRSLVHHAIYADAPVAVASPAR